MSLSYQATNPADNVHAGRARCFSGAPLHDPVVSWPHQAPPTAKPFQAST